jgi:hypothetical protein
MLREGQRPSADRRPHTNQDPARCGRRRWEAHDVGVGTFSGVDQSAIIKGRLRCRSLVLRGCRAWCCDVLVLGDLKA